MTRRVKITKLPEAGYGRPISEGWTTRYKNGFTGGMFDNRGDAVRKTITSVPREDANVEAEGGETVVGDFQKDGLDEFYNIEGPRHADGPGVPLNLPESFIFSDTRKMRINNPDLLKIFGKGKGSYTPAALSKQYQLNDYNAKLKDKDVDPLEKETAELMINNNRDKLSKLAIIQEVYLKGGNVPEFAYPYLKKKGIDVSQLATDQDEVNEEQYSRGGNYLPKAQNAEGQPEYDFFDAGLDEAAASRGFTYERNPWQTKDKQTIGSQLPGVSSSGYKWKEGRIVGKDGKPAVGEEFFKTHPAFNDPASKSVIENYGGFDKWWKDFQSNSPAAREAWVTAANTYSQNYTGKDVIDKTQKAYNVPGLEYISVGTFKPIQRDFPGGSGGGSSMASNTPPAATPTGEPTKEVKTDTDTDDKTGSEPQQNYDFSGYPSQPFFKSDMVDLYGAAYSLFDNVDIPPTYQRTAAARTINPVLEDPTRAIANRQEGAARQTDAIKAFGRNPSAASSYMQGLAAGDTADIISGVNQRNIGTLNQFQGINSQMLTNYDRARQMSDRQYDVDLATYLQQKANTKAQKRNVFTDKLSQAYTNQADINQINAQDPSYYFDTRLNNTAFTGRPGNSPTSSTISTSSNLDNMSDEDLDKLYKKTRIQESQNRMQQRTQQGNRLGYINNQRRRR